MVFQPGQSGNPKGREPGIRDRRVRGLDEAMAAISARIGDTESGEPIDAHTLLVHVYRERELPIELRVLAARAALKVEKPSLLAANVSGDINHHVTIADQLARARRREIASAGLVIEAQPINAEIAA